MELEYSDKNRRRSKLYIAAGVIVALIVAATVYLALQASGLADGVQVESRTVVVAVNAIGMRQPIAEGDVTTRSIPADPTNETAFESVDMVIGRVSGVAIEAGQVISPNLLASTTEGMTFSILEPGEEFDPEGPDLRAVSVTVAAANAVGGALTAGQLVDLLVTMPINPQAGEEQPTDEQPADERFLAGPSTKVTVQAVTILAREGDVYILRVDLATAEEIAELTASGGTFTLVLRPDEDERMADTEGSTIDSLIEEYDFPAPLAPVFEERQSAEN